MFYVYCHKIEATAKEFVIRSEVSVRKRKSIAVPFLSNRPIRGDWTPIRKGTHFLVAYETDLV